MNVKVAYVSDEEIEKDAEALLSEFARTRGATISLPVPIDDVIEKYLKLRIDFDDLHRILEVPRSKGTDQPDILGAIFFAEKRIIIDETLDPDENPSKEGRYRYTTAHEVGHWRLHRQLFTADPAQGSLLDVPTVPSVVCRTSDAKARIEVQADVYASCLLMPRKLVFAAWNEAFPDGKPRILPPAVPTVHPFAEVQRIARKFPNAKFTESDEQVLNTFSKPFAEQFLVSAVAMRIRLEKLGLIHRTIPAQRLLGDHQ